MEVLDAQSSHHPSGSQSAGAGMNGNYVHMPMESYEMQKESSESEEENQDNEVNVEDTNDDLTDGGGVGKDISMSDFIIHIAVKCWLTVGKQIWMGQVFVHNEIK